jgi:DNA polymerase II small subunit/DNA polymerase delta subunit B
MHRECTRCKRPFAPADLRRDESKNMLTQRKAAGLEGVRFLYYHCAGCGMDDIFVDILPLESEPAEDYQTRRDAMEEVVRGLHADGVHAVVVPVNKT